MSPIYIVQDAKLTWNEDQLATLEEAKAAAASVPGEWVILRVVGEVETAEVTKVASTWTPLDKREAKAAKGKEE